MTDMKKKKIIIASALTVLAAGIAYAAGFPVKLMYWDEYKQTENIDVKNLTDETINIPDDWQEYELRTLMYYNTKKQTYERIHQPDETFDVPHYCESYTVTDIGFKAPAGLVYDENDNCFTDVLSTDEAYKKDPTVRKVYIFGGSFDELGFTPMECVHLSLIDLHVDEDKVNSLAKALGKGHVEDGVDVYLVGAELGTSDFNFRTYHNAETFFKLGGELAGWGFSEHIRHYSFENDSYKAAITQCLDNVPLADESFTAMRLLTWDKSFHSGNRTDLRYNPNVDPKNFSSFAAMHLLIPGSTDAVINLSTSNAETDLAVLSTVRVKEEYHRAEENNDRSYN